MWSPLSFQIGQLLLQPHCPLCGPAWAAPKEESPSPCSHCRKQFDLPSQPLQGDAPLPWMAVGHYSGTLRRLILHLRKSAHDHPIRCLSDSLQQALPTQAILIPIPSWKQTSHANRLPERIANVLNRPRAPLLARSRAVVDNTVSIDGNGGRTNGTAFATTTQQPKDLPSTGVNTRPG